MLSTPRTKIATLIARAVAMIPGGVTAIKERYVSPKNKWRILKGWDAYHHNMITSSPEEIAKHNAKVVRRNKAFTSFGSKHQRSRVMTTA